jgi:tripartite-type tricarboxylate transporter receptor subunit TctC
MKVSKLSRQWAAIAFAALATCAFAGEFPERPIKLLVGYPAGGPTDIIARLVAEQMGTVLKVPVIVENKPGAGGNIATAAVTTSDPDGYTLLMGSFSNAVNPAFMSVPYDSKKDLQPISNVARFPVLIIASKGSPFNNVPELLAAAKARPSVYNYGAGGIGSSSHLAAEMFKGRAQVDITGIQYKGAAPALQDLLSNTIQLYFDSPLTAMPYVQDGRVKLIAVTTAQRLPWLPEVPTVAESGIPGFDVSTWAGVFGRAGTPPDVIEKLNKAIVAAVASQKLQDRFKQLRIDPVGDSPAQFKAFFDNQLDVWAKVVVDSRIKVE